MNAIAIIPARGGSKRIPGKNIRSFAGKPIIQYGIEAALASGLFSHVWVSTDDLIIADTCKTLGVTATARPPDLASDTATTAEVLAYELMLRGKHAEYACCIYPCAPFLKADYLREGREQLEEHDLVIAATQMEVPIERVLRWTGSGLDMVHPKHRDTRSQDLPTYYRDAGMFYWVHIESFLKDPVLWKDGMGYVHIPREHAIDIDTEDDWRRAEQADRAFRLLE